MIFLKTFKALVDKIIRCINYLENINTVIRCIPRKENVLSDFISRTIKKEILNDVTCYSVQLNIYSYDQNDLHVKQLNKPELSLVTDYFESAPKPKSMLPSLFKRFEPQLHLEECILLYYYQGQIHSSRLPKNALKYENQLKNILMKIALSLKNINYKKTIKI